MTKNVDGGTDIESVYIRSSPSSNDLKIQVGIISPTIGMTHPSSDKRSYAMISTSGYNLIKIGSTTTEICSTDRQWQRQRQRQKQKPKQKQIQRQTHRHVDTDRHTDIQLAPMTVK